MRPLIFLALMLTLAGCRSHRQLQTESVGQSTIDTQTSTEMRSAEEILDLYSADTTIELTDITITTAVGKRHDTAAGPGHDRAAVGSRHAAADDAADEQTAQIHIGKATITNATAAEKHIASSTQTEATAAHHSDTSAESKQQSKSDIKAQTAPVTISFWILVVIILVVGYLYARRIRPK